MAKNNVSYLCPGFYPIKADNLMHAAVLFAVWKARRKYGPGSKCTRLVMQTELGQEGATFEAQLATPHIGCALFSEPYRFTVLIDRK